MRSISQLVRLKTILKSITVGIPVFFFALVKRQKQKKESYLRLLRLTKTKQSQKEKEIERKNGKGPVQN